ncbi:MAG: LamG-like jellyroll fold domain-containing protein [Nakamurella sp.]
MKTPPDDGPSLVNRRTALKAGAVAVGVACVGPLLRPAVADAAERRATGLTAAAVPQPIAQWRFTERTGPYKSSIAGAPSLIRPTGSTAYRVSSPFGGGIVLNGTTDYLRVPAAGVGPLAIGATTGRVTVAAWVLSTDTNTAMVAGCWQESRADPRRSYALFCDLPMYGGDDMVCMEVSKGGDATPGYPFSIDFSAEPQKITRGQWQFYAGTYDGAKAVSYLNGVATPYPSYTDNQGASYSKNPYFYPDGLSAKPVDFTVGAVYRDGSLINILKGTVAKLRVWNVALTPSQLFAIHRVERKLLAA